MGRNHKKSLALCLKAGTLFVSLSSGYGRGAYATSCSGGGGTYSCGPGIDVTQNLSGGPLLVTTSSGFAINTVATGGDAFNLFSSAGGLTFFDDNNSTIVGKEDGIVAINDGGNSLSLTTTSSVTAGTTGIGIWTDNRSSGTDLIINAASVSGGDDAINANNSGSGNLSITTSGTVQGGSDKGILANNSANGTDLTISAGKVTGGTHGIVATNSGRGLLSITTSDQVAGGNFGIGIWANNFGSDLTITATEVTGGDKGILATNNNGTGNLSITTSGTVSSTGNGMLAFGISATNKGSGSLSITASDTVSSTGTGAYALGIYAINSSGSTDVSISATDVLGGYAGIYANASGSGTLSITSTGLVEATRGKAIVATNSSNGRDLTISVAEVKGSSDGIVATNSGHGALSISTSGTVTGTSGYGIHADNDGGQPTTITVGAQSIIEGGTAGIKVDSSTGQSAIINVFGQVANLSGLTTDNAIISSDGPTTANLFAGSITTGSVTLGSFSDTITLAGTLNGSVTLGGGNDTFIQVGGSTLTGIADGGLGNDILGFNNMGMVDGSRYRNFENLGIFGGSTTLTGIWDFSAGTTTIYQGILNVNGALSTSLLTVGNGGRLVDNGTISSGNLDVWSGGMADINGTANIGGNTTVDGSLNIHSGGRLTTETLTVNAGATASILGTVNVHGATDIFGSLSLDGSLATSQLTVEHGGFLGGNGSILGDVSIYGTISPGHSLGSINVDGSLSFMPGSTYIAELAANGSSDQIRVNGPVSINGGTVVAYLPIALYANGHSWHILTATDGVHGNFSSINTGFTSYTVKLDQQILGNSLDLVIVRTPYSNFGATENQAAVGATLDDLLPSAHGSMANLLLNMDFAMTPSQLTATLKGLSPEMYTAFPAAGLKVAGIFNRMVTMRQQEEGPVNDTEQLWDVWGQVLGQQLDRDAEAGISGYTLNTDGTVFGMDRAFGQKARAGLVLGYSSSDISWNDADNSGRIDGKYIGIYGGSHLADFYINGTAGYTNLDNSANRTITTPLFTGKAAADFKANVFAGNLNGGYDFTFGNIRVGPVVALDYQYLDQQDYSEKGGYGFAMRMENGNGESLTTSLGMRLTDLIDSGDWRFLPRAEVALVHQSLDDGVTLTSSFVDYPAATFTVCGAKPDANEVQASLGLSAEYKKNLSLYLNLSVTQADHENSRLLAGGLTWSF